MDVEKKLREQQDMRKIFGPRFRQGSGRNMQFCACAFNEEWTRGYYARQTCILKRKYCSWTLGNWQTRSRKWICTSCDLKWRLEIVSLFKVWKSMKGWLMKNTNSKAVIRNIPVNAICYMLCFPSKILSLIHQVIPRRYVLKTLSNCFWRWQSFLFAREYISLYKREATQKERTEKGFETKFWVINM